MFDEVNEGTAIFKAASHRQDASVQTAGETSVPDPGF
jgi:hypothetical protein